MNRREAIKSAAFLIGSATTFTSLGVLTQSCTPAFLNDWTTLSNEYIQQMLAEIAGTIIPQTETPGAKEVDVQLYITKMLLDCEEPKVQQEVLSGLKLLDDHSDELFGDSFVDCQPPQREEILAGIEALPDEIVKDNEKDNIDYRPLKSSMKLMKRYTIRGYMNSKYYLTEVKPYKLIPGEFNGCIAVDELPNV